MKSTLEAATLVEQRYKLARTGLKVVQGRELRAEMSLAHGLNGN